MHKATITAVVIMTVFALSATLVLSMRTHKSTPTPTPTPPPTQEASLVPVPTPSAATRKDEPAPSRARTEIKIETMPTVKTERAVVVPTKHTSMMTDYAYQPKQLIIKKGDSITWVNNDMASHTITSEGGSELSSDYRRRRDARPPERELQTVERRCWICAL